MRTLSQSEISSVNGAGKLGDWLASLFKTNVNVDVVAKPEGSTRVDVKSPLANVLVNVVWGGKKA